MRRYSEAVKADVRRRMSPPHRQSVARISEELGIHVITLYKWRKAWRLQGEVVPASETVTARKDDVPAAVTFREGVTPWLPLRRPGPRLARGSVRALLVAC